MNMHYAWPFRRISKYCLDRIVRRLVPEALKCNARIAAETRQFRLAEVDNRQGGFSKLLTNRPNAADKSHLDTGSGKPQSFIDCDSTSATLDVAEIVQHYHLKIVGCAHDGYFNEYVSGYRVPCEAVEAMCIGQKSLIHLDTENLEMRAGNFAVCAPRKSLLSRRPAHGIRRNARGL